MIINCFSSFRYIRIQQNPGHYAFAAAAIREKTDTRSWEEWLDHYVEVRLRGKLNLQFRQEAIGNLQTHKFVTHPGTASYEEDPMRIGLGPTAYVSHSTCSIRNISSSCGAIMSRCVICEYCHIFTRC